MRKIAILLLFCSLFALNVNADKEQTHVDNHPKSESKAIFDEAKTAYDKGDFITAKEGFLKADKMGHFKAKRYLALMLLNAQGEQKDEKGAFEAFKEAAENGDITSMFYLGRCYENGIGVESNLQSAIEWYKKGAVRGDHVSDDAREALKRLGVKQ
ncbi:MAG: sel1 repeat family protein [Campylobacter sp.]|nr:sel1 repeat family protein [Campylobacter sp.]